MNIYGYIRVSSRDQNEDRQLIALKEVGVSDKNIYIWTSSLARILTVRSTRNCCEK